MTAIFALGVGTLLFAACGFYFALEAEALTIDGLFDAILGKRRSRLTALVPSTQPPVVAVPASEPKARVVDVWMNRGWRSIQATPAPKPLLLTWVKPNYTGMTVKALREACKERGVKFTVRTKKAELLKMLG